MWDQVCLRWRSGVQIRTNMGSCQADDRKQKYAVWQESAGPELEMWVQCPVVFQTRRWKMTKRVSRTKRRFKDCALQYQKEESAKGKWEGNHKSVRYSRCQVRKVLCGGQNDHLCQCYREMNKIKTENWPLDSNREIRSYLQGTFRWMVGAMPVWSGFKREWMERNCNHGHIKFLRNSFIKDKREMW